MMMDNEIEMLSSMEGENKNCQLCGRELDKQDEKYCIFHSNKPDKDAELFQKKLFEIFKDKSLKTYGFSFFTFPKEIFFPPVIDKNIIFNNATFLGDAFFYIAAFQNKASFKDVIFKGKAFLLVLFLWISQPLKECLLKGEPILAVHIFKVRLPLKKLPLRSILTLKEYLLKKMSISVGLLSKMF
ncbi:MAG: hypothetical protein MUO78_09315 [candidate division Zixibacteria bacterium]|nr:hypothetical protein [candidate division Zixibacteria bacterium]